MNGGATYGFIGLGNMGGPMAANLAAFLAAGGHPSPVVFDAQARRTGRPAGSVRARRRHGRAAGRPRFPQPARTGPL